eukprot:1061122-Rhodomonas_salina.2
MSRIGRVRVVADGCATGGSERWRGSPCGLGVLFGSPRSRSTSKRKLSTSISRRKLRLTYVPGGPRIKLRNCPRVVPPTCQHTARNGGIQACPVLAWLNAFAAGAGAHSLVLHSFENIALLHYPSSCG